MSGKLPPIPVEDKKNAKGSEPMPAGSKYKSSPKMNNKKRGIALVLVFLILAGVLIPLFLVFSKNKAVKEQGEETKINVETSNEEIKELIRSEYVYTGSGVTNYYSPSIDSSFSVDVSVFRPSESSTYVSLFPTNSDLWSYQRSYAQVRIGTGNVYEVKKEEYNNYDDIEVTESKEEDGYMSFSLSYTLVDTLGAYGEKGAKETVTRRYLYKEIEDEQVYVYVEVIEYEEDKLSTTQEEQLAEIIKTFQYKPEDAPTTASVKIPEISASVIFDKKSWELVSQYQTSANFSFYNNDYNAPYTAVSVRGSKIYGDKTEEEALDSVVEDEFGYAKESDEKVKITKEPTAAKISDIDVVTFEYQYPNYNGTVYVTSYYGLAPSKDHYFEITIRKFVNKDTEYDKTYKEKEINELINGLEFETVSTATETTDSDKVLGESALSVEEPALVGKISTVHIGNVTCATFKINDPDMFPSLTGTEYKDCGAWTGTGFFVNSEGYIVTNAHVGAANAFQAAPSLFSPPNGEIFLAIFKDVANQILAENPYAFQSEEDIYELADMVELYIMKMIVEDKITATNVEYRNYLELDEPFQFKLTDSGDITLVNVENYPVLELVEHNELESVFDLLAEAIENDTDFKYEIRVADLAVLKAPAPTNGTEYPAIALGDEDKLIAGADMLAIGFPAITNDDSLFSEQSATTATITRGTISALKDNTTNEFKFVQTDTAINHGNSGGPMINSDSEVIAVSTYGVAGSNQEDDHNHNAGVAVGAVHDILNRAGVTAKVGSVTEDVLSGIDNMQKDYYTLALEDFARAEKKYPGSADELKPLKLIAQEKIDAGEDNSPLFTISNLSVHPSDMPYVIGGLGIALFALVILLIVVVFKKPKNKDGSNMPPVQNANTMQPTQVGGPVMQSPGMARNNNPAPTMTASPVQQSAPVAAPPQAAPPTVANAQSAPTAAPEPSIANLEQKATNTSSSPQTPSASMPSTNMPSQPVNNPTQPMPPVT